MAKNYSVKDLQAMSVKAKDLAIHNQDYVGSSDLYQNVGGEYLKMARAAPESERVDLLNYAIGAYKNANTILLSGESNMRKGGNVPTENIKILRERRAPLSGIIRNMESTKSILESKQRARESALEKGARSAVHWAGVVAILSLFGALFFISLNLTGAAIGDVPSIGNHWLGLGLFAVGIAFAMLYFRKKVNK